MKIPKKIIFTLHKKEWHTIQEFDFYDTQRERI